MRATKNDLPPAKREKLTNYLNQMLANAIDLKLQVKEAHWNTSGENFIALHELFDKVVTAADEASDLVAERVMQLGGEASGTVRAVAKTSRLKDYTSSPRGRNRVDHVDAVASAIAEFNKYARKAIDDTDAMGDAVTADIMTGITRDLDKYLWLVEAHLEK